MAGTDQITKLISTPGGAMFVVTDAGEWAEENFGGCEFGDKRRGARLVRVARDVARHVGDSLLACCGRGGRPARRARLCLRAQSVELAVPKRLSTQGSIRCFALLAREEGVPEGVEPLEWLLLTTEPVRTREEALDILWIYSQRWRIEEFHKAWKSGANVEALRPRSANNLERGAVILAFVAVRLLQLRELVYSPASRGGELKVALTQQPCDKVLSETEWKVLYMTTNKSVPPTKPPSAEWAYRAIAKLGGWSDTQRTGRPGWQAIWRGLFRLAERVETHLITLEICKRSDQGQTRFKPGAYLSGG